MLSESREGDDLVKEGTRKLDHTVVYRDITNYT